MSDDQNIDRHSVVQHNNNTRSNNMDMLTVEEKEILLDILNDSIAELQKENELPLANKVMKIREKLFDHV